MKAPERLARRADPPGPGEAWTVLRMILWSAGYLEEKGVPEPRLDAEYLLADALGVDRLHLYLQHDRPLTEEELAAYKQRLKRRADREPLQYVVGTTTFRELELGVDRRALIPRPETEELVQAVLDWCRASGHENLEGLDVGTGTGAIALSLAKEGPFRRVVGTDSSREALARALENLEATGLSGRVELRVGPLFDPVGDQRFDVIAANPPYVAEGEVDSLPREIREFEPLEALVAGPRGAELVEGIADGARAHLTSGGLLAVEVGQNQAEALAGRIERSGGYHRVWVRRDLAGKTRFVLAEASV